MAKFNLVIIYVDTDKVKTQKTFIGDTALDQPGAAKTISDYLGKADIEILSVNLIEIKLQSQIQQSAIKQAQAAGQAGK